MLAVVAYKLAAVLYTPGTPHWQATMTVWANMSGTLLSAVVPDNTYERYPNPSLALAYCYYELEKRIRLEYTPEALLSPNRLCVVELIWSSMTCRVEQANLFHQSWVPALLACDDCADTWHSMRVTAHATFCHAVHPVRGGGGRRDGSSWPCMHPKARSTLR